jgi:hypothetical protein
VNGTRARHAWPWRGRKLGCMCRNITELRGLEPPATREEIEAAARQYIRKVSGIAKPSATFADRMEEAALEVASITEELLAEVPARRQPPKTLPPLRRPEVRQRLGLEPFLA